MTTITTTENPIANFVASYGAMVEGLARQYLTNARENGDSLRDFLHSINDPRDPGLKIAVRKRIKELRK